MVPKVGDKVVINPSFKKAYKAYLTTHNYIGVEEFTFGDEDGPIEVTVVEYGLTIVTVWSGEALCWKILTDGRPKNLVSFIPFGFSPNEQLFLPFESKQIETPARNSKFKFCNCTSPILVDSTTQIAGGGQVFKYCRKCKNERQ